MTVVVSLMTTPKTDEQLKGLVYGAAAIPKEEDAGLLGKPILWAGVAFALFLILQWIFW